MSGLSWLPVWELALEERGVKFFLAKLFVVAMYLLGWKLIIVLAAIVVLAIVVKRWP